MQSYYPDGNLKTSLTIARSSVVAVVALLALVLSAGWLDEHYHVKDWLAWTLAIIWGWQTLLAASVAWLGNAIVVRVLGIRPRSLCETVALAVPTGVMAFSMGMFVAGFLGLLTSTFSVLWPLAMLAGGSWMLRHQLPRMRLWLERERSDRKALDAFGVAATVAGILAVGLVYLQNFSPSAITYDAAWTHLAIAQDYAREGRIVPFWADWPKNLPHLGSVINTWSFLVPGLDVPAAKYMMALHTEFVFFLWTLVSVTAVMQRLDGWRSGSWASMFLFPALFVYDHCLGGGADHFVAFFAPPMFLALLETVETGEAQWWVQLAIVTSGALMTKMQAAQMAISAMAILAVVLVRDIVQRLRGKNQRSWKSLWSGPLLATATSVVLTAPHFVKNLIYFRNPIFPFAQDIFTHSRPTMADAPLLANYILRSWGMHPAHTLLGQVKTFAVAVITFPCHPNAPESGALFAVGLVLAPFLPNARRLWLGLLFACGSLAVWNLSYPQGRNLQGILPVVAAVTGASLIKASRLSWLARMFVAVLLALQVVAGFDNFFANPDRISDAISLIRSGRNARAQSRFDEFQRQYIALGRSLPLGAVVLLHTMHTNLGIDRTILHDGMGFQSLIDARTFHNAREYYLRLKEIGVTYIVYEPDAAAAHTRQEEAIFSAFALPNRDRAQSFGGMRVFSLPPGPPPDELSYEVFIKGIGEQDDGLYPIADLGTMEDLPRELRSRHVPAIPFGTKPTAELISRARVVLLARHTEIDVEARRVLDESFSLFTTHSDFSVLVRVR